MKNQGIRNIQFLMLDVDGTLTDGKIYMGDSGEVCKAFNIKDGYGICNLLPSYGIRPIVVTGRISKIVENRCKELKITELYQGIHDKQAILQSIINGEIEKNNVCSLKNVAYIGDDLNDLSCMKKVVESGGVVGCPQDAVDQVKSVASYVCRKNGGEGAVREFIDWMIKGKGLKYL